jgi:6-phosphofructokinase 1
MPKEMQFNPHDKAVLELIKNVKPFEELTDQELKALMFILKKIQYKPDEVIVREGDTGSTAYIVSEGTVHLDILERGIKNFSKGEIFGEVAFVDERPRMGTVIARTNAILYSLNRADLNNEKLISLGTAKKVYKGFARLISSYLRAGSMLYEQMDILLVMDGGCAPGYNPAVAFISEYCSKLNRQVFIAAEGFSSIVSNRIRDYWHLVYDAEKYKTIEHIPGVLFSPRLREARGADFRAERYPEFKYAKNQKIAAKNLVARNIKVLIGIGGNGTFAGINALSKLLPSHIQTFFVPVTVDSDIYGTECIGEYTGVEVGSEKIRGYMADARTHKRFYIIEMMGARGGYHALHSCLGAGAHLAVLPNSQYDLKKICRGLEHRDNTVIVVAEGYKEQQRKKEKFNGNAAEYFHHELLKAGLKTKQRIICEGFSRDLRGATPNNMDISLTQRLARGVADLISSGSNRRMPAVLSDKDYSIPFDKITTDNAVITELASLANRITGE